MTRIAKIITGIELFLLAKENHLWNTDPKKPKSMTAPRLIQKSSFGRLNTLGITAFQANMKINGATARSKMTITRNTPINPNMPMPPKTFPSFFLSFPNTLLTHTSTSFSTASWRTSSAAPRHAPDYANRDDGKPSQSTLPRELDDATA
jgi:hypothetical protein